MTPQEIVRRRLRSQRIAAGTGFSRPEEVVSWFGAVQAQEFAEAKWALGLRMAAGVTDADVERAFAEGAILRTHVLRPTWHFVAPADIRWMLALTGPRVNAVNASLARKLGVDDAVFAKSNDTLARALAGGKQLTRAELADALRRAGVEISEGVHLSLLVMRAELDGVICSGARRGKQFTYALLDERVPPAPSLSREEARAELVRRYFTSHGPATLRDFAWWSGLTLADARAGVAAVGDRLTAREGTDGATYFMSLEDAPAPEAEEALRTTYLLPAFDEYTVAYRERGALVAPEHAAEAKTRLLDPVVVEGGRAVGTWRKRHAAGRGGVRIEAAPFTPGALNAAAFEAAAARYRAFAAGGPAPG
jgi:Protein of unknown function (DUF1006).